MITDQDFFLSDPDPVLVNAPDFFKASDPVLEQLMKSNSSVCMNYIVRKSVAHELFYRLRLNIRQSTKMHKY